MQHSRKSVAKNRQDRNRDFPNSVMCDSRDIEFSIQKSHEHIKIHRVQKELTTLTKPSSTLGS